MATTTSRLFSPMHRALRQFQIRADEFTRPYGIGGIDGHALLYVASYGPCPISELSRILGSPASTLTGIVGRLSVKGYVSLAPTVDRRVRLLRITRKGRSAAAKLRGLGLQLEGRIIAQLASDEVAAFHRVLSIMHATLAVSVRPVQSRTRSA